MTKDKKYTVSPWLSGWLGPEKVPGNKKRPWLSGSGYCEELLVKNPGNQGKWDF